MAERELNFKLIGEIIAKLMSEKSRDELKEIFGHGEEIYNVAEAAAEAAAVLAHRIFFADEPEEVEEMPVARDQEPQTEFDKFVAEGVLEYYG